MGPVVARIVAPRLEQAGLRVAVSIPGQEDGAQPVVGVGVTGLAPQRLAKAGGGLVEGAPGQEAGPQVTVAQRVPGGQTHQVSETGDGGLGLAVVEEQAAQVGQRIDGVGPEVQCLAIARDGRFTIAGALAAQAKVVMVQWIGPVYRKRAADVIDGDDWLADLHGEGTEQVQGLGVTGILSENATVKLLGLREGAGLMLTEGPRQQPLSWAIARCPRLSSRQLVPPALAAWRGCPGPAYYRPAIRS